MSISERKSNSNLSSQQLYPIDLNYFIVATTNILIMAESFLSTAELRAMFDEIDTNKNGTIDLKELDQAMARLQMPLGSDISRYVFF